MTQAAALAPQQDPLTAQEIKLMTRLLSDPTLFPKDFKEWVTAHASDSVDIAKGQVHGLINSTGDVIIAPPPLVTQIAFKWFDYAVSGPGGSSVSVISIPTVACDGNPVIVEFFAPFNRFKNTRYAVAIDNASQFYGAEFKAGPSVGGDYESMAPLYLQYQFTPSRGDHKFEIMMYPVGSYYAYCGGGGNFDGQQYQAGFFRISRA